MSYPVDLVAWYTDLQERELAFFFNKDKKNEIWLSLMTKALIQTKLNNQLTTQKRRQKLRLHNDCRPT